LERIAERRRHGTGLYLARLFQRQTIEDAGLALHYLLASAIAQTQSAGQTLPATRDRIAHSPGNVALLAAVSDRYRAARGFRARRALRAAAAEIVGRMDRHTLEDLDPELFRFVDKMLRPSRRRSEFDETLTKTRQDVAERSYPSRIPTLRRYLQKRVITYGSQALAGVGLSFLFGKLYFSSAAPFIHGSPKDLVFAGLAVLLGVGAGVVHARADHASNRSTEAADLARRAAEERRRARKAGDPTAAFGGLAADAVSGAVSDVHRQLEAGTRAQERLTELLQELQPRLDSGQVTPANIAAAMPASAPSSTSAARPAQRRRVTPSPWAQADRPIPGRTPPYNVYFRKNLTPGIAQVVTSIALTGFGAGAWPYTGVVTLGNALHMIFDPLTKMRIAHFAQVNTSTRRQQERARDERHHRSREVAAAKMATALLLDVPDVQRSLAWADATQRLVAALEVVADPAAHPGETAPAGPSGRVDLVPPAAAPLHMAHRTTGPLENLLAAAPAELITGFGSGIPALWINGPAGATQVGIALLNVLLAFPSEGYGFQKYYGALDVAHAQYALELEQDRRAATVAFTHSAGMRLAERIEAALQELPPETVQQIDSLRSEVLSRIGWKAAGPPEPVGRVVASYAQSRPSPSLRPPFRHQLWRDLPAGVAQAVLGMAVAATWPGLSAAEATEQGITAAANNGLNSIVKWAINGFAMTDEVRGYNAQLLYERLSDIQQTAAAAQAHLRALQPAIDDMAAAVAEHRAASDGAVEAIRDFLSTYPAGGGRHRRTDGEPR
jgi:hypothetical protein